MSDENDPVGGRRPHRRGLSESAPTLASEQALQAEVDRLTRERDDLQDAIRVAWEAIDATDSLAAESALHNLIQAVPLEVRQRWVVRWE